MNIEDLRKLCSDDTIQMTAHAIKRCRERNIMLDDIIRCIMNGRILENYPEDYPYPSALVFENELGKPIHVVAGIGEDLLWIITAYYPDLRHWNDGYKTRRER